MARRFPTRPSIVELDTNQWNYLVEDTPNGLDLATLRSASRAGRLVVLGSVDLFEELAATHAVDPPKCQAMLKLFFELVGPRLLRPLDQRQTMEVEHGGQLPERNRYLSSADREAIRMIGDNPRQLELLAADLERQKSDYLAQQEQLREDVRHAMRSAGLKLNFKGFRRWYETEADLQDWVRSGIAGGVERGLYDAPGDVPYTYRRFPSTWLFMTFQLARIVFTVGEGRRINGSDLADAHHTATGSYTNFLITDDRMLRAANALMPIRPTVLKATDFKALLATRTWP